VDDDLIIEGSPEDLEALRRLLEAELGADAAVQPVTSAQSGELREPIITALVVGLGGPVLTNAVASVIRRYLQLGASYVSTGNDISFLSAAAAQKREQFA